ncbi:MAG: VTT domain-containing protein [Candidatus Levyibacteriota bacterium]
MLKNKYFIYSLTFILSIVVIVLSFLFQEDLLSLKRWGIVGIFLLNFFSTATIFVPNFSLATVVAGGSIYNPILVAIVATIGGVLGDSIGYLLGHSGRHIFVKKEGKFFQAVVRIFHKHGSIVIFVFALVPNPIFDALGILAGSTGFPIKKFIVAMFLGRLIRNIALAYVGNSL